jgi:type III pantothenate kinase
MLLCVDVGNTETTIGVFDRRELVQTWRLGTQPSRTADELALMFSSFLRLQGLDFDRNVTGVAIASVVPSVLQALREMVRRYFHFEPVVVGPGVKTGMPILIDNPKEVGADRIVGAVAAFEEYGGPVIVVDLGTATTFDAVSEAGEYLGGAISPGMDTSANALVSRTAQLKRVEYVRPPRLIGKSTVEAIQSGVVIGYACLIEGMVELFRKELGGNARTVITGGLAEVMEQNLECIDHVDPWLVLKGLRLIYDRNT